MATRGKIDALLKSADEALLHTKIVEDLTVADGYDSAIAAFGPTVVQSGLLPAMAFYCAPDPTHSRKTNKSLIVDAIAYALKSRYNKPDHKALFRYCLTQVTNRRLMADIVDASVALKIMVRTYQIKD